MKLNFFDALYARNNHSLQFWVGNSLQHDYAPSSLLMKRYRNNKLISIKANFMGDKMKPWGFELEDYIREDELDKAARADAWRTAIGLQAVDGLKPSRFLIETAKEHIEGNITIDAAQQRIEDYYKERVERNQTE